ncbi:MAG: hypothetical protein J6M64_11065 [Oscillospiraceae bacterium]|nr:hypothetical protein [Oscillospiraceae bacterium]
MTIGFAFILACLILVPCVFLFSGSDTDHPEAIRKECRRDALLDWTDKDLIAAEQDAACPVKEYSVHSPATVRIETVDRDVLLRSVA